MLADPSAPISQDVTRIAAEILAVHGIAPAPVAAAALAGGPCRIRVRSASSTPGSGGLTVLREILRRSPRESTIYLGDNARAPYGTRTDEEVRAFSTEALDALVDRDVKAIVVACNTSTAVALGRLPPPVRPADPRRRPARAP